MGNVVSEQDALFRLMVENVRDYSIVMLDRDGQIISWNHGAERITGYRADEVTGKHFSLFYPQDEVEAGTCVFQLDVAAREGRFEAEGWRVRKDGSRIWVNVVLSAVRDDAGALRGFTVVSRDVPQRKRGDAPMAQYAADERFHLLVDSVRDYAIFMLDPTGHVATWNAGAERIKGYRAEEIIGSHFSRFYPEEDIKAGKCEMELDVAAREGRFEDEGWRVRKDGSRFWANVVISAVRDRGGHLIGFSKVTRDLTERKQMEEDRAARYAAEEANRTKDEFLAMLGHELRNPLAPILTALQLVKLRGDDVPRREFDVIERQVRHMMHLVDDLLDVARITKGKLELRKKHVDLRNVLVKAVEIASPLLDQRNHHFEIDMPPNAVTVDVDEARLTQVVTNLLNNAAKYTEPGGHVRLGVALDDHQVAIRVSDDGTGIAPQLLPRVFDLFVQGYRGAERTGGGLGIGLTLVRQLVEMHGGQVTAESEGLGHGSTFTVTLPAVAVAAARPTTQRMSPLAKNVVSRRILVVDDNEDAAELLSEALSAAGHEVRTAADPSQALAMICDFRPELAILDIGLPVMDGYELARKIRSQFETETPRLFALTGYGQQADRERSRNAGFDAHFVKPVDVKLLIDRISTQN